MDRFPNDAATTPKLQPVSVYYRPYVQTWAQQGLPSEVTQASRTYLLALCEEHVGPGLTWLRTQGSEVLPSVDIALVTSLASLLQVPAAASQHTHPCMQLERLTPRGIAAGHPQA